MPATDLLFRIRAYLHDAVAPGDLAYRGDEHPISLLQEVLEELPDLREEQQLDLTGGDFNECEDCVSKDGELEELREEGAVLEKRVNELAGALDDTREQLDDARGAALESRRVADLVLVRLNKIRQVIVSDFEPEELTGAHRHLAEILALTEPEP